MFNENSSQIAFILFLSFSLSFINISNQSKISSFQELTGYSSSTSSQIHMNNQQNILAFLGLKAFSYSNTTAFGTASSVAFPAYNLIDTSYMKDSKASVIIKLENGEYLMGCGNSLHLAQFQENGILVMSLLLSTPFDDQFRCSINEIDTNLYLLSYTTLTPLKYYIETFLAASNIQQIIPFKSFSMNGFLSPIICNTLKKESNTLILCIFYNDLLRGKLFDALLYPKIPDIYVISNTANINYSLYPLGDNTMIVFSMEKKTATVFIRPIAIRVTFNESTNLLSVGKEIPIIDRTETKDYYCSLEVSHIFTNMFIACVCNQKFIYFQRYFYDLTPHGIVFQFDSGVSDMHSISIQFFSIQSIGIISSHDSGKNYLLAIQFPRCQSQAFLLQNAGIVNLISLIPVVDPALNQRIVFKTKSTTEVETNPPLNVKTEYPGDTEFIFLIGGFYQYLFTLFEEINGYNMESFDCALSVEICNNKCLTCIRYGSDDSQQCLTCNKGYHLDPRFPNQCLDTPLEDGSYIDPNDNIVKKCYISCATCSGAGTSINTNCDSCDTSLFYQHPIESKQCVNVQIDKYYIDTVNKRYAPCYSTCENCSGEGTPTNNMCTACINGFTLDTIINTNCVNVCLVNDQNIYFDLSNNYFCTSSKECILSKPYLIVITRECVDKCPDNTECVKSCPLCPPNTYQNIFNCDCITDANIEIIVENADSGIISLDDGETNLNWRNSTIRIYKSSSFSFPELNISVIEPSEIEKIKRIANIPLSEDIIIYLKDTYLEGDLVNDINFSFYYINETQLLESDYANLGIVISFPIRITDSDSYLQGKHLNDLGIDATDPYDPFFTHICYEFQTGNHTDIPRRDKYQYYLMDRSKFCPKKCSFESIDYEKNISTCRCNKTEEANIEESFEDLKASFIYSILDANWEVIICDMLVFNNEIIPTNIGHWLVLFMIAFSIGNFIVFLQKKFEPLKRYLKSMTNDSIKPTRENIEKIKLPFSHKNSKINVSNDITNFPGNENRVVSGNQAMGVNSSLQVINEPNQSFVYSNVKQISFSQEKKYTFFDYKKMTYEEIIVKDKRTFTQHYWDNLKLMQPIIYTFIFHSKTSIPTIKIAVFIIGTTIDFSVSAFFFFDRYISNIYRGQNSFWYNLPISMYTYMFRFVFSILFYLLTSSSSQIEKIKMQNNGKSKEMMTNKFMKWYRIRIIIFFSLKGALLLFFWYYTAAFCGTYKNSQVDWILSGFTSLAISQVFPLVVALVYAGLIEISIKQKLKWLYKVYNLI